MALPRLRRCLRHLFWPPTPSTFACFSDLEDAAVSARNLRALILHIAGNTSAERIHVIVYSAGTRVVTRMQADLGMYGYLLEDDEVKRRVKLGNVILVGIDVDQDILAGYALDGALRVPDALSIYRSRTDKGLGMPRFVFRRSRAGQVVDHELGSRGTRYFSETPELRIIDVSDVESSDKGNGHGSAAARPSAATS